MAFGRTGPPPPSQQEVTPVDPTTAVPSGARSISPAPLPAETPASTLLGLLMLGAAAYFAWKYYKRH